MQAGVLERNNEIVHNMSDTERFYTLEQGENSGEFVERILGQYERSFNEENLISAKSMWDEIEARKVVRRNRK